MQGEHTSRVLASPKTEKLAFGRSILRGAIKWGVRKIEFADDSFKTDDVDFACGVASEGDNALRSGANLADGFQFAILLGHSKNTF